MAGGLFVGLSHKDAARFAFLLATPIIGAAALLKLPELFGAGQRCPRPGARRGDRCGGRRSVFCVRFLMRYFETQTLIPFAVYCFVAGLACTIYFVM